MRNPEIKITQRNVTGMRQCNPTRMWVIESSKLIMIVALVAIVGIIAVMAGA
jgi:hypothetical protein